MQRLEAKSIHGRTYYYLSLWGWKNGKCRRLSQKYLGKPEDIARAVAGPGPAPEYAVVLDWGLPQALWQEAERAQVVQHVDQLCPKREQIPLSEVCYDGTNFYTFIDTFNLRCQVAQRGKNKQGRGNLRQVSYALFCTTDGHLPLFYDVYEGNRNDAKEFPQVLARFERWLKERAGSTWAINKPTLIFDKGNNSADNFALIDALELPYVGSVKLDEHPDLAQISNQDTRWQPATQPGLEPTKSWRTQQVVYGQERTLVLTYNQNLFESQWATVQNDLAHALSQLAAVQQNLQDRAAGLIQGGTPPTVESVQRKCEQILHRQHLPHLVETTVTRDAAARPQLRYHAGAAAQQQLKDTYLGKTLLITGHQEWSDAQVIRAYRSQFVIEEIFHEMKDRHIGAWWPLHHWTDSKIQVHGLYCTIAVLLRALLWRRARQAGLRLSMNGLLQKLSQLRQVINVFPAKRAGQPKPEQEVLTKRDQTQEKLIEILGLQSPKSAV